MFWSAEAAFEVFRSVKFSLKSEFSVSFFKVVTILKSLIRSKYCTVIQKYCSGKVLSQTWNCYTESSRDFQ